MDFGSRGNVLYIYSENKGTDQLRGDCAANPWQVFSQQGSMCLEVLPYLLIIILLNEYCMYLLFFMQFIVNRSLIIRYIFRNFYHILSIAKVYNTIDIVNLYMKV